MTKCRLLIVEDEFEQRQLIQQILDQFSDYEITICSNAEKALSYLEAHKVDILLTDWKLPKMNGLDLLAMVKEKYSDVSCILMTAYGSISHAVSSIRAGADDYLAKPFEKDQLLFTLRKIETTRNLRKQNAQLENEISNKRKLGSIIGSAKTMEKLYDQIDKLSDTDVTVLLHGESGTGKELVANTLHINSKRATNSYLAVNCSAIPESLAEAELFGAEKGAYTGADKRKIGKVEAAHGGTLFLDEIADLPISIQAKLLRFLQEGTFMRVGGNEEIKVEVRVIAASHKSLAEEITAGRFREDLYYRLNIITLTIPPLRQRTEDIPALAEFFIHKFADQYKKEKIEFNRSTYQKLIDYHWPGNVRELSNLIERLTVMHCGETITPSHINLNSAKVNSNTTFTLPPEGIEWESFEKSILKQALDKHPNRSKAAKFLGLNYKAFLYRLEKYRLTDL